MTAVVVDVAVVEVVVVEIVVVEVVIVEVVVVEVVIVEVVVVEVVVVEVAVVAVAAAETCAAFVAETSEFLFVVDPVVVASDSFDFEIVLVLVDLGWFRFGLVSFWVGLVLVTASFVASEAV